MEREALKLALEALEGFYEYGYDRQECFEHITAIKEALAQPAQEPRDIAKLVEGMEVSIDVSTGEHDSGNRLFGTVTLAQENQSSKHGLILLVQEPEPNFKTTTPPQREWNAALDEAASRIGEIQGFGKATQDSFAVYIKGLKK